MPLTGPIPEGHSFFCPSCGALYAVTYSRPSGSDSDSTTKCVVCGQVMAEWNSTNVPRFKSSFSDLKTPLNRSPI